jgi:F-type H+-transporting ATPase subunit b
MEINPLTVLATIINFGIFFLVMRKILFNPVNNIISSRENEISTRIKNSQENEKKAELLRLENEENLKNSKETGKQIVSDYKSKAEQLKEEIVSQAKTEAEALLERARTDAEREREKANQEIKTQAIDLAILLSSKALEKKIDEEEHRRLIKDFISKVGV